ncbi:MAG: hypothetical protein IT379_01590 [Deltaproteobacteria bacterium]|nr:hypothetical protein [Deltaproteobacteria bacterium]
MNEGCEIVSVGMGQFFSCALRARGTVVCWGANDWGQLGDGTLLDRSSPDEVPGVSDAVELAVGGAHACARLDSGLVQCWGANVRGAGQRRCDRRTRAACQLAGRGVEPPRRRVDLGRIPVQLRESGGRTRAGVLGRQPRGPARRWHSRGQGPSDTGADRHR